MTQSIGLIGGGVLGSALARCFMEWVDVKVFDLDKGKATHTLKEAATADIVMICLPSPAKPDGRCDTSAIDGFLHEAQLEEWWRSESCYVLRSTVPCGYTQAQAAKREFKLPLLHSPEFLTARCARADVQVPARNIIGCPSHLKGCVPRDVITLYELYQKRFPGVPIHVMSSDASELVKLATNSFFASKVTLFNLFHDLAKARGLDWESVRGGILSDGRIAHAHSQVQDRGGYGGQCLPKDLADLFHCCQANGVDAEILRAVHERNVKTRGDDPGLAKINLPCKD